MSGPEALIGKGLVKASEDFYRPIDIVNLWDVQLRKEQLSWPQ